MYCAKCGHPIPDGAKYCPACSHEVKRTSASPSPASSQPVPSSPIRQDVYFIARISVYVAAVIGLIMGFRLITVFLGSIGDVTDFMGMYSSSKAVLGTLTFVMLGLISCIAAIGMVVPAIDLSTGRKPDVRAAESKALSFSMVFLAVCVLVWSVAQHFDSFPNDFIELGLRFYLGRFGDTLENGIIFGLVAVAVVIVGSVVPRNGRRLP